MDSNQAYQIWTYAMGKNLQQGYGSPEDFYTTINIAQKSYTDFLLGEYQKYQIQRPISVVEIGQNARIQNSLAPLIYGAILPITPVTGISPFPGDYEYIDAMWSIYGNYNIRFAQQDRLDSYVHSEIDPVVQNPIYLIQHEGFHFFPDRPYGDNQAKMAYIRTPPSIVWGYNLDSNGIPVWNPATSQDPVWGDTDMLQIIVRALALVGVNLQFGTVLQYSQEIKNSGQ